MAKYEMVSNIGTVVALEGAVLAAGVVTGAVIDTKGLRKHCFLVQTKTGIAGNHVVSFNEAPEDEITPDTAGTLAAADATDSRFC